MEALKIQQLDYRYILIDSYKELGLNEKDLAVLLVCDNLLKEESLLITRETLALKMTLSLDELDEILVSLINRGFLEYDTINNNFVTTITPTYKKICDFVASKLLKDKELSLDEQKKEACENIYSKFESVLARTLTSLEFEKIKEWISEGIDEKIIENALEEVAAKSSRITINAVDKCLRKRIAEHDIKEQGFVSINEKMRKDINETIDIINTDWLKK